jgi:class 3 adenylate cyclase
MEPEKVIEMLNAYFEEMVDVVFKYEGTLDKFIGDALMAVWGGPLPCADGPMQAVRCALEMQARMQAFNQAHAGRGWPPLAMGVGINTGPALVGNLGSSRRMEYTVLGHTVNLASRLESLNKECQSKILISETLWQAVQSHVIAQPRQVSVKGVAQPLTVYVVEGARAPEVGPGRERRRAPRLQVALDTPTTLTCRGKRLEGVVVCTSRTGAGVIVAVTEGEGFEPGQPVELTLRPAGGAPPTRVSGTVVRVEAASGVTHGVFRIGLDLAEEQTAAPVWPPPPDDSGA